MKLTNLVAAVASWVRHNSSSASTMNLFSALQLRVVAVIEAACSKIHISLMDGRQRAARTASWVWMLTLL
jgi:hypothetical protein